MPKTNPRQMAIAERHARALELRAQGRQYKEIAQELGITVSGAWRAVVSGLKATLQEPADLLRTLELQRLAHLESRAWDEWERSKGKLTRKSTSQSGGVVESEQETYGDPCYLQVILSCIKQRCKILGLDMPDANPGQRHVEITITKPEWYGKNTVPANGYGVAGNPYATGDNAG